MGKAASTVLSIEFYDGVPLSAVRRILSDFSKATSLDYSLFVDDPLSDGNVYTAEDFIENNPFFDNSKNFQLSIQDLVENNKFFVKKVVLEIFSGEKDDLPDFSMSIDTSESFER
ncbi:MAG: hypothetical protein QXP36_12855 [Conexivisphaerales archaeon]